MDEQLRLDGNAAAGSLGEVFPFEMTMAEIACGHCASENVVGALMVYKPMTLGTVMRCPSCDNVLMRVVHNAGNYWLEMQGARYLRIPDGSSVTAGEAAAAE
jgi:hypothetical protein